MLGDLSKGEALQVILICLANGFRADEVGSDSKNFTSCFVLHVYGKVVLSIWFFKKIKVLIYHLDGVWTEKRFGSVPIGLSPEPLMHA